MFRAPGNVRSSRSRARRIFITSRRDDQFPHRSSPGSAQAPQAGGIPVLDEAAIIPFKARAWLDLTRQRAERSQVDEKNIRKHRNDVARLLQLLSQEAP